MTDIVHLLDHYDKVLMLYLNYDGGVMMDSVWKIFSAPMIWILVAVMFIFELIRRKIHFTAILLVVVFLGIAVGLSDFVSSSIIKPYCERFRPSHCVTICDMLHYVDGYRGGQFGFVSSHAATTFSIFIFISLLFWQRLLTCSLLLFVICICYSRIYLGVHYPGDILCGAMVGATMGGGSYLGLILVYRIGKTLPHFSPIKQPGSYLHYAVWSTMFFTLMVGVSQL